MHLPDGFVSGPVNVTAAVVAAGALRLSWRRLRRRLAEGAVPLLGMTAAFVFAAQMLNFPVAAGVSGHFLGAMLTAVLLGPAAAVLVISLVLTLQCLLFADGGLTALGTNIVNMGLVAGVGGHLLYRALRALLPPDRRGLLAASAVAAWSSVTLAATACAVELAVSGSAPWRLVLPALAGTHAVIGLGEAAITWLVLSLVLVSRPDLVGDAPAAGGWPGPGSPGAPRPRPATLASSRGGAS